MTSVLVAGDHFVVPHMVAAELASIVAKPVRTVCLNWPVEPFGPVAEVDEASGTEEKMIAALDGIEICVTQMGPITASVLESSPQLKLVCVTRGGPVNVNLGAARSHGVLVCNSPGRNAVATAEHAVTLIMAAARRLPMRHAEVRAGQWRSDYYRYDRVGPEIAGSTVGLVGYGAVGRRVGMIMAGLGATVVVHDPYLDPTTLPDGTRYEPVLDELLATADIVSLHARLTPKSAGLIGEREICLMRPGSILVNSARGGLLDYEALVRALTDEHLYAAGLDVFDHEPIPADSPLRAAPNLVMTPHLAGATRETAHRAISTAVRQVHQFVTGQPVDHVVT